MNDEITEIFNKVIFGQKQHEIKKNIKFHSSKFDFYIFINCLNYLKNNKIKNIEAFFLTDPNYDLINKKQPFFRCNLYTLEDRKKYAVKFYNPIQTAINEFVDYYKLPKEYRLFPNEEYHYFVIPSSAKRPIGNDSMDDANVSVIITEQRKDELNNVTIIEDEKYLDHSIFINAWENGFTYKGKTYKVISWSNGIDSDIFHELPLYKRVYSHFIKRLEKIKKGSDASDVF
jgi:hypothetical protein